MRYCSLVRCRAADRHFSTAALCIGCFKHQVSGLQSTIRTRTTRDLRNTANCTAAKWSRCSSKQAPRATENAPCHIGAAAGVVQRDGGSWGNRGVGDVGWPTANRLAGDVALRVVCVGVAAVAMQWQQQQWVGGSGNSG